VPDHGTILITGAAGFLGTWLAEAAHQQGFELVGVDIVAPRRPELWRGFAMQSCDRANYAALVGGLKLNAVFHLAGSASVPESVKNPSADFASLLPGTVELLVFLSRLQPNAHLVFFSSAALYGNPVHLPVSEDAVVAPISPYGIHKAAAECLISHYARLHGMRASILRIFSAYGEGLRKQVVWDLCQKSMTAQREGGAIALHGTGEETRDFIHAADIARAALLVAQHPPPSGIQVVNIASGEETAIRELAGMVLNTLDSRAALAFNGARRACDPANWRADISRLQALGFTPSVSLPDGIARSVRWQARLHGHSSSVT
jgi:UDP-glucose 4-epimerase